MRRLIGLALLLWLTALASTPLFAHPVDSYAFHSVDAERRALALARRLRCPQCQNQNLVESNASIAQDLRLEVYRMVDEGRSDDAVITHMTSRFGEFVLYEPPLRAGTLLLWMTPAPLLLLALWLLARSRTSRTRASRSSPSRNGVPAHTAISHGIWQEEYRLMERLYPDSAELRTQLAEELAAAHGGGTALMPLPSRRSRFLSPILIAVTLLAALFWYSQSDRWQAVRQWRHAPDPLASLNDEDLKDVAQQKLEKRIRDNPRNVDAWSELGQLYLYRGRYVQALQVYDLLADIAGEMTPAISAAKATALYYQAGETLTTEAQRLLEQTLADDPGEVTALMLLATDHFRQQRYSEAVMLWQRLLDEGRPGLNRETVIHALQTARMLEAL